MNKNKSKKKISTRNTPPPMFVKPDANQIVDFLGGESSLHHKGARKDSPYSPNGTIKIQNKW
jgi:hypothetical protein